jgi:hypothetical protein
MVCSHHGERLARPIPAPKAPGTLLRSSSASVIRKTSARSTTRWWPGPAQTRTSWRTSGPLPTFFHDRLLLSRSVRRRFVFPSRLSLHGSPLRGPAARSALNIPSVQRWTTASGLSGGLTSSSARLVIVSLGVPRPRVSVCSAGRRLFRPRAGRVLRGFPDARLIKEGVFSRFARTAFEIRAPYSVARRPPPAHALRTVGIVRRRLLASAPLTAATSRPPTT